MVSQRIQRRRAALRLARARRRYIPIRRRTQVTQIIQPVIVSEPTALAEVTPILIGVGVGLGIGFLIILATR